MTEKNTVNNLEINIKEYCRLSSNNVLTTAANLHKCRPLFVLQLEEIRRLQIGKSIGKKDTVFGPEQERYLLSDVIENKSTYDVSNLNNNLIVKVYEQSSIKEKTRAAYSFITCIKDEDDDDEEISYQLNQHPVGECIIPVAAVVSISKGQTSRKWYPVLPPNLLTNNLSPQARFNAFTESIEKPIGYVKIDITLKSKLSMVKNYKSTKYDIKKYKDLNRSQSGDTSSVKELKFEILRLADIIVTPILGLLRGILYLQAWINPGLNVGIHAVTFYALCWNESVYRICLNHCLVVVTILVLFFNYLSYLNQVKSVQYKLYSINECDQKPPENELVKTGTSRVGLELQTSVTTALRTCTGDIRLLSDDRLFTVGGIAGVAGGVFLAILSLGIAPASGAIYRSSHDANNFRLQYSSIVSTIEKAANGLSKVNDQLERILNTFSYKDEFITLVVSGSLILLSLLLNTILLYQPLPLRYYLYFLVMLLTLPVTKYTKKYVIQVDDILAKIELAPVAKGTLLEKAIYKGYVPPVMNESLKPAGQKSVENDVVRLKDDLLNVSNVAMSGSVSLVKTIAREKEKVETATKQTEAKQSLFSLLLGQVPTHFEYQQIQAIRALSSNELKFVK